MKKFLNKIILLLTVIGITSCADPIDPVKGGSNSIKNGASTIQLEEVSNGVKIILPTNLPKDVLEFQITKIDVNHPLGNNSYNWIMGNWNNQSEIMDYFIQKDVTYKYTFSYYSKADGRINLIPQTITTTKSGIGNSYISPDTKVSYNSENGIMSITPTIDMTELKNILSKSDSLRIELNYKCENNEQLTASINPNGTVDFAKAVLKITDKYKFGDFVTLDEFYQSSVINNVWYRTKVCKEDLIKIIPSFSQCERITIPDMRKPLILTPTNEGIQINFPEIPQGEKNLLCNVYKRKVGETQWDQYLCTGTFPKQNNSPVIDYFVDNNKEYEYKAEIEQLNELTQHYAPYMTTTIAKVTSIGGKGEIKITNDPVASYDKNTCIMTFTEVPTLPEVYKEMIPTNDYQKGEFIDITLRYGYTDENGDCRYNGLQLKGNTINWASLNDLDSYMNRDLSFMLLQVEIEHNGFRVYKDIKGESFPNIPQTIKISDLRPTLTGKATENGIEIDFLTTKPESATYIEINRCSANDPSKSMQILTLPLENFTNNEAAIDYFVNPNETYTYTALYLNIDTNETIHSVPFTIKAKSGGLGEIELQNSPKATYNPTTGIMTFTEMPQVQKDIDTFIRTNLMTHLTADQSYFRIWYLLTNQNGESDGQYFADISKTVNFFDTPNSEILYGRTAHANGFNAIIYTNKTSYHVFFPKGNEGDVPDNFLIEQPSSKQSL